MSRNARLLSVLVTIALVVGIDQVTKRIAVSALIGGEPLPIVGSLLQLDLIENRGWFLTLGCDLPEWARRWVVAVAFSCVLALMSWAAFVLRVRGRPLFGAAVILAGASSSVFDHLAQGESIDFIALRFGTSGGVACNVADLAIALGLALLFSAPRDLPDTDFQCKPLVRSSIARSRGGMSSRSAIGTWSETWIEPTKKRR